jgi:hypothetical protein
MLPEHLVVEFWAEVEERLRMEHGLAEETARYYITTYQERMKAHGGVDIVYHEDPADVARGLSHGGILHPEPTPMERRRDLTEHHPELANFLDHNDG